MSLDGHAARSTDRAVVRSVTRQEPSAERDACVSRALRSLAAGGSALTGSTDITDGLRKVAMPALQDANEIRSPSFAWLESVAGRDIQRLGSVVTSVGYYRVSGVSGNTRLLVYFDEKGLIADLDLVDE